MVSDQQESAISPAEALEDLRATARWIITAAAGVGALLLGGLPIASIGKIRGVEHFAVAFSGVTIALLAVGWAIWKTSEALMPRLVVLAELDGPDMVDLKAAIDADPPAFYGGFDRDLRAEIQLHFTVSANLAELEVRERDQGKIRLIQHKRAIAAANAANAQLLQVQIIELIHAWKVRNAVRSARLHTMLASLFVIVGSMLFLWAADASAI